ncbi:hypothetical protein [Methylobacterium sp. 37f]|uniref:hypothetical protein n=1 Tax=Methylobacterium sp. 37f TaxID=2817058 RepID=UPI001FFC3065|nr:hypothetical protein [Methylobacterium sp. 37f]MCK2055524.1 hypothetical protein [Methylobacterium sp. 37f]
MLVALILFLGSLAVGLAGSIRLIFGISAVVLALSGLVWLARGEVGVVGALVLFAHLTALQAGYLTGAYRRYGDEEP